MPSEARYCHLHKVLTTRLLFKIKKTTMFPCKTLPLTRHVYKRLIPFGQAVKLKHISEKGTFLKEIPMS